MKAVFFLFLWFPSFAFAQIKMEGKVIDAVTKQPIPYVNLESFKYKAGTQSNQNGAFVLELAQAKLGDTVRISCVGYLVQDFVTSNASNINIELTPSITALQEVVVRKGKSVLKEVGVVTLTGESMKLFNQMLQKPGTQNAVLMKGVKNGVAYLKAVHFLIGREGYNAPFRLRIYSNTNNMPGHDLPGKSLQLQGYKKSAWNEFDLMAYFIEVPEEGVWVAIEWIANEKFAKKSSYVKPIINGKPDRISFVYYGPEIIQRIDSSYGLTYRKLSGADWHQHKAGRIPKDGDRSKIGFADILAKATIQVIE